MIEIELFYKIVESEIRKKHIRYLKRQKCVIPEKEAEQPQNKEAAEEFPKGEKTAYVRRFNKGIDTALKVLANEFKAFISRL